MQILYTNRIRNKQTFIQCNEGSFKVFGDIMTRFLEEYKIKVLWLSCFCLSVICKILRSTKQLHMSRVEKIRADHHADTVSCCYDFTMTNFMR